MDTETVKLKLRLCKKLGSINARIIYGKELKPRENEYHYLCAEALKQLKRHFLIEIETAILYTDISVENYKSEVLQIIEKIMKNYEGHEEFDFSEIVGEVKRKMKLVEEPK